jgi:tetratricopeptide (TPR) repeat protein
MTRESRSGSLRTQPKKVRSTRLLTYLLLGLPLLIAFSCSNKTGTATDAMEVHKQLAGELRDNKLYKAAIEEYQKILDDENVDIKTRANINYLIAKIYFEDLENFEEAAAYYVRARTLDPEGSFAAEAAKNLVASLEKIGHMLDAKRQLAAVADIDAGPKKEGDVAVARVGGVPIWLSEIEGQIQALPQEMQKQFLTREAKIKFAHNYVATELLYRAAVREDYGSDPEIQRKQHMLYKQLLVDKYLTDKVIPQVQIDTVDVRNYYLAHKDDRYEGAPYDSVKAKVFLDYQGEKTEAAFGDYISKLANIEKVEFLDQNVR